MKPRDCWKWIAALGLAVAVEGAAQGTVIFNNRLEMRVWEAAFGSSYDEAVRRGGKHGRSMLFEPTVGGPIPNTPGIAPLPLIGLKSFKLEIQSRMVAVSGGLSLMVNPLVRGDNSGVEVLPDVP